MGTRYDLTEWVINALKNSDGQATIIEVAKYIWNNYEHELRSSGDLFYTWQYDIRWAATELRKREIIKDKTLSPKGIWELI